MTVTVTLTFDTIDDMLYSLSRRSVPPSLIEENCDNLPVSPVSVPPNPFLVIMNMLDNGIYKMRKLKTLAEKSGLSENEVFSQLNANNVSYVIKHKRDTNETLIKLD